MLAASSSDEDESTNRHGNKYNNFLPSQTPQTQIKSGQKIVNDNGIANRSSTNPISNKLSSLSLSSNNGNASFKVASNNNNNNNNNYVNNNNVNFVKQSLAISSNDTKSINSINSYSASSDEMNTQFNTQSMTPSMSNRKSNLVNSQQQIMQHGDSFKSNSYSVRSTNKSGNYNNSAMASPGFGRRSSPNSFNSKFGDEDDDDQISNDMQPYNDNEQTDDIDKMVNFKRSNDTLNKQQNKLKQQQQVQNQTQVVIEQNQEIEDHKKRLQIYVFVCRCIAYHFIAKQPTDMVRRQVKITKQQLQQVKDNFELFLDGKMQLEADEAFTNAVRSYYEVFLKSDRISKMVSNGGCSAADFRDVFKNNIEKRVRSLPEIDGLSKETVLTSWTAKFDAIFKNNEEVNGHRRQSKQQFNNSNTTESTLTKEQLYDLFQNVLGIKKFEHQLIFNAAQVRV